MGKAIYFFLPRPVSVSPAIVTSCNHLAGRKCIGECLQRAVSYRTKCIGTGMEHQLCSLGEREFGLPVKWMARELATQISHSARRDVQRATVAKHSGVRLRNISLDTTTYSSQTRDWRPRGRALMATRLDIQLAVRARLYCEKLG